MFAKYNIHNNDLYNKLVNLSRNIFFYKVLSLKDTAETRIMLIYFHFCIILIIHKISENKKFPQDVFDNIFLNLEYTLREMGLGDVAVNKKMKLLNKIFYDILLKINTKNDETYKTSINIIKKYFPEISLTDQNNASILADYFDKFFNFCFDINSNNMIKGDIKFTYNYNGCT